MKAKIVLVNPAIEMQHRLWFPLGIGYIAAFLRKNNFEVVIIDVIGENLSRSQFKEQIRKANTKYFGVGGLITAFNNVVDTIGYIKEIVPDSIIFAGNTVAYTIPEILFNQTSLDYIVLGEGEITTLELLNALINNLDPFQVKGIVYRNSENKIITTQKRELIEDLDQLPFPAWDLLPLENYFRNTHQRYGLVSSVRGCPYNCIYCCKTFIGSKVRYRSPQSIINELLTFHDTYKITHFYFFDDLSTVNKKRIIEFCNLKHSSKLKYMPWTISARVNLFDEELAGYLKKTFCSDIGFGIESYDQNILDSINKKVKIEEIDKAISICKQFELNYSGSSFMVGYFDENEETIKKSSEFAMKNNLRYEPHFMTPYPGTKLYEFARQKGLIIDEVEYIKRIALQGNTSSLILNLTNHLSDEQLTIYRNKYIFFPLPAKGKITFSRILNLKNYAFRDIYKKISNLIFKSSKTTPLIEDTNSNIWI